MNTYKKTIITLGIALLAFQACHATAEFDRLKLQLNGAFDALFGQLTTYRGFRNDAQLERKAANFTTAIKNIEQFVKINNKGLIYGPSAALEQASNTLLLEDTKLKSALLAIRNQLQQEEGLTSTKATVFFIAIGNVKERIKNAQEILRPKINDYKSTGQKESYELLMHALQTLHNGATVAHDLLRDEGWLKKR